MSLLTALELKALVDGVWSGNYSADRIPSWLFNKLGDEFRHAAISGWGNLLAVAASPDEDLEKAMRENVYYFAAHKAANQLNDMHQLMLASKNKYEFTKAAIQVDEKYNHFWFDTEHNTTTRIARSGREWRRILNSSNIYPKLQFDAVNDSNTRSEHAALDGIIQPINSPFWKKYFPPLDWNCRCRVIRIERGANTDLNTRQLPPLEPEFSERVTESKRIWSQNHPYFRITEPIAPTTAPAIRPTPTPKPALTPTPTPNQVEKAKARRVKKAIDKAVKTKIAEDDDKFVFSAHNKVRDRIKLEHPKSEVYIHDALTKEFYKENAGNFHAPRFLKNLKTAFQGANAEIISIRITKEDDAVFLRIAARSTDGAITLIRSFRKKARGLSVHHDFFKLPPKMQGNGLSKKVFALLYEEYRKAKITYLDVLANIDVGGYTWAKYGFQMELDEVPSYIKYSMGRMTEVKKKEAFRIYDKYVRRHPNATNFPMVLFTEKFKENMLGTNWNGYIDLKDKKQREYFKNYIYGTK